MPSRTGTPLRQAALGVLLACAFSRGVLPAHADTERFPVSTVEIVTGATGSTTLGGTRPGEGWVGDPFWGPPRRAWA